MSIPSPMDKTLGGVLRDVRERLGLVERRLAVNSGVPAQGVQVDDWNLVFDAGLYWSEAGALNAPYPDSWQGRVIPIGGALVGHSRQELTTATAGDGSRVTWSRVYSGTAWGKWKRSDGLMIPTSVAGGTFDPKTGRLNFTPGSKQWTMDGVFTAEFRAYSVLFQWYTGAQNGAGGRYRMNGADIAPAAGYGYSAMYNNGTTVASAQGTTNQGTFPPAGGAGQFGEVVCSEPMFTAGGNVQKRMRSTWAVYSANNTADVISTLGGYDTAALDGFTMYLSNQAGVGVTAESYSWMSIRGLA